ncbi:unnamed protein product [Cuscuta campestris]|uniref:Uncharacterized protein n=1 Tax=Cuscuta campestris TaxID=132261 RepID=A0A484N275_9ASTE|nr:unnamed protein product [Cuscuta campestris]
MTGCLETLTQADANKHSSSGVHFWIDHAASVVVPFVLWLSRSVPPFTIMIVCDSDSASPSSNSSQVDHSASGHDQGLPSFRCISCPQSNATLLSITWNLSGQGTFEIKKVVTKESLAALGFGFVKDEHRHQPDLLRDFPGGSADSGPFEGLEEEMESDLLIGHFIAGRKRKRDAAHQTRSKCSSSHSEDGPPQEQVVIEVQDHDGAAPKMGMTVSDLAGSSQRALSERPPSPPVVTYEVATECRSTRFSIPPLSPSHAGMIELIGWRQDRQAAMDEAKKAAEDKQRELQNEVACLARELEEEKGCSANLEVENASLSSEMGSVSTQVAELEGEKVDLIQ